MSDEIVNKVAESGIISLDLQDFLPEESGMASIDLKDFLFMGLILKEKDFRAALHHLDWGLFEGKAVAVHNSTDAIIPAWAYMLVAAYLQPIAATVFMGDPDALGRHLLLNAIASLPAGAYEDKRVVIKGCGETTISPEAYVGITLKLRPVAKSIMYGEPCSTVPVFKKK